MSAYRRAAPALRSEAVLCSDEDYILAALHPTGPVAVERIIYYYSWINHAGISESAVVAILENLIARGLVKRNGSRFELAREWP